jgi:flagellar biosynthesis GTPase FlhF
VLLTVLLVPVRYRIHAEHGEKILVKGWVSWLLHLIHVSVSYIEEKLHIQVRIAGIILFDNLKPREPKVKKEKKKKRRKKKRTGTAKKNKVHNVPSNQAKAPSEQKQLSELTTKKEASVKRTVSEDLSSEQKKAESTQAQAQKAQDQMAEPQKYETQKIESTTDTKVQKQTILSFLKKKLERFREFQEKLSSGIQSFKKKLRDTFATIKTFRDKWELIKGFIKDKVNREGFQVTWKSLKNY